ncbi:hypothetical protein O6H91_12G083300 [Diphasiastrum complanatum]|nr:hypothetical protein O6H91_12G083300 [Diphasiastrum complanatum]
MDTLYRIGETRHGVETYTPRLLALDLRGSLGAVRSCGSLYNKAPHGDSSSVTSWTGPISTFREEPITKNKFLQSLDEEHECLSDQSAKFFSVNQGSGQDHTYKQADQEIVQDLEDGVQFWTDYLKAHTHPSSLFEIQGAWNGVTPFQDFGCGRGWLSETTQAEEFQNRFRFFVEECDHLQGIQVIVDDSGGFSGVASDLLEGLMDDFGKSPFMLFTVRPPRIDVQSSSMKNSIVETLHDAVSFSKLSSLVDLVVPLQVPNFGRSELSRHLCIKESSFFHTSAVYAAAISNITLPFRMRNFGPSESYTLNIGSCDMGGMLRSLTWSSARKVAELATALPAPAVPGANESLDLTKLISLSPFGQSSVDESLSVEAIVFQGARLLGSKGRASIVDVVNSAYGSNRNRSKGVNFAHLAVSLCPLAIPLPFPKIFRSSVGHYGDILADGSIQKQVRSDVSSVPVVGRLKTSQVAIPYIKEKITDLQRFGISKASAGSSLLQQWGFPSEEACDLKESLLEMVAGFGGNMDTSTSDSD